MISPVRLRQFKAMLLEEVAEGDSALDVADLADWLGDMIVYCASEARRHGLPIEEVLHIIMDSNASKLGADGNPLINQETGKVEKGPNYWKPEPKIRTLLMEKMK
jgi:predicted HAD superfamily Cof-like phosphohydrolase